MTGASRERPKSHESWYMEPWEFKQRQRREARARKHKERRASRTAPETIVKSAVDLRDSGDESVWIAVADSEERREKRRFNKEERERIRAGMLTRPMTQQQARTSADVLAVSDSRINSAPTVRRPSNSSQTSGTLRTAQRKSQARTRTPSPTRSMRTASPLRSIRAGGDMTKPQAQRTTSAQGEGTGARTKRPAGMPATSRGKAQTAIPGRRGGSKAEAPRSAPLSLAALGTDLKSMDESDVKGWSDERGEEMAIRSGV